MMRNLILISALLLAQPALAQTAAMGPAEAVAAAQAKSEGVEGVFEFQVASTGAGGFNVYLNSAANYRDAGNLTVLLNPSASTPLRQQLGGYPEDVLKGKRIRVKGTARRVPVGDAFQVRIEVDAVSQIEILG
jgi:hypothetical protein